MLVRGPYFTVLSHQIIVVFRNFSCNILDFQLLGGFHTMTLHVVTFHSTFLLVRTLHQSEPSVGSFSQDLENQFYLLLGSLTDPTNKHKTF